MTNPLTLPEIVACLSFKGDGCWLQPARENQFFRISKGTLFGLATCSGTQNGFVDRHSALHVAIYVELVLHPASPRNPHLARQFRLVEELADGFRKPFRVARRKQQPGLSIHHDFGYSASARPNNGLAESHSFDDDPAERLRLDGSMDHHAHNIHIIRHTPLIAGKNHMRLKSQMPYPRPQPICKVPVEWRVIADKKAYDFRETLPELRHGLDHCGLPFPFRDIAHYADDQALRHDTQLL